jgi:hypothetical protein
MQTLDNETQAWAKERNERLFNADWRFTTADTHIQRKQLYPKFKADFLQRTKS